MKKHLFSFALIVCFLGGSFSADSATLIKEWSYGGPDRGYEFQYIDDDGGYNYQCTSPVSAECGLWDWKAVYELGITGADPNPEINTAEYGHNLVVQAAGSQAPNYLPVFSKTFQ